MKKKIRTRAAGVTQTSIAIPDRILKQVSRIAAKETRSRNQQIQVFLEDAIKKWSSDHKDT